MPYTLLRSRRARPILILLALAAVMVGVAASIGAVSGTLSTGGSAVGGGGGGAGLGEGQGRPNIVFVLTDDLSMDLLRFMPHVQAMQHNGITFNNYFVSDSLCCPSRSSIFTGNLPHDTGVFSNVGATGGFHVFYTRGEELNTFAVALQQSGYSTAMMGKYLNGYLDGRGGTTDVPDTYVPPGWSEWDVGGQAYREFDYRLNENGTIRFFGHSAEDYLTDVIAHKGVAFIDRASADSKPFFLELSTFAPHSPYVPAPRDANRFPGLTAPRPPNFDVLPNNPPRWLANHGPLSPEQLAHIDEVFRLRAEDVVSVDDMIGQIEQALIDNGIASNTYIVFSSDNGLHTGEYRLMPGKMTAFDTDIRVPLIVTGPGVPAGTSTGAMAENIDLAKTFEAIGGASGFPSDGHSLLPLLQGQSSADWRNAIVVEHHGPDLRGVDPDYQQPASGSPRTYEAMRTDRFLYVEYDNGEREFYDLARDPFELNNLAPHLTTTDLLLLHSELEAIKQCHGGAACWDAMHLDSAQVSFRRRPHRLRHHR